MSNLASFENSPFHGPYIDLYIGTEDVVPVGDWLERAGFHIQILPFKGRIHVFPVIPEDTT